MFTSCLRLCLLALCIASTRHHGGSSLQAHEVLLTRCGWGRWGRACTAACSLWVVALWPVCMPCGTLQLLHDDMIARCKRPTVGDNGCSHVQFSLQLFGSVFVRISLCLYVFCLSVLL